MHRILAIAGITLGCAGCVLPQPNQPELSQIISSVAPDDPSCIVYSTQATVGQTQQPILGRACRQADGTWKVTEGSPGQPTQVMLYAPPPDAYLGTYDPWLWGPPIGFSIGGIFFADRDHHLHRVRDVDRFEHHRFEHHRFGHFAQSMGMHHG